MAWPAVVGAIASALAAAASVYSAANQPKSSAQVPVTPPSGQGPDAGSVFQSNVPSRQTQAPRGVQQPSVGEILTTDEDVKSKKPSTGEVLAATPDALQALAAIMALGRGGQRDSRIIGAQGGGAGGQIVPGLGLPALQPRATIGEILNTLPRPRYG